MAKAHVPKFGNWESAGNVPYTQYFENARKGKVSGKIINPNDPQESPETFDKHYPAGASPIRISFDSGGPKQRDVDSRLPPSSPLRPNAATWETDTQRRTRRTSTGSDRSLEQSPFHPNYQARSRGTVGLNSPAWENRGRPGGRSDGMPEKGSAVPKFGEWDENDPASADEFSHIFDRVREEKQVGSARAPNTPKQSAYSSSHKPEDRGYESTGGCCCFGLFK